MMNYIGGPWPRRTTTTIFFYYYVVLLRRSAARAACQYNIIIRGLFLYIIFLLGKMINFSKKCPLKSLFMKIVNNHIIYSYYDR